MAMGEANLAVEQTAGSHSLTAAGSTWTFRYQRTQRTW